MAESLLNSYRANDGAAAGLAAAAQAICPVSFAGPASTWLFRELRALQGAAPAWAFARSALRHHPSLLGLDRLLEAELAAPGGGERDQPGAGRGPEPRCAA